MKFQSNELIVKELENNIVELQFNNTQNSVNKLDQATVSSLSAALDVIESDSCIKGILITSAKKVFIVGADITEFLPMFEMPEQEILEQISVCKNQFERLASLPFPTCVAINGYALGGGLECALACDFRVMSSTARVGLPESNLGLLPGWGGTVRLPRLIGIDQSLTWMATGKEYRSEQAFTAGVVDAVVEPEELHESALNTLKQSIAGKLDHEQRRNQKNAPMPLNKIEATLAFFTARGAVQGLAGKHYPAPLKIVDVVEASYHLDAKQASDIEAAAFAELAKTGVATALIGNFLADQMLNKKAAKLSQQATADIKNSAVLGAGIMGGGIAYQSAYKGVPIKMKDIAQEGLDLGLGEANKLLSKRVNRGRMRPEQMGEVLNKIDPMLSYDGFDGVDIVVEAVVENQNVKQMVLAEAEAQISEDCILCSNTSTISISALGKSLQRPENFCGMHFFNPVHAMPLVEVIRGEKTSDAAVAATVAYATKMGKKALVVNDCPGFLVNRVLFPYIEGFSKLVRDGADFQKIDQVMERWGWPMGPAYLIDVVGIDTVNHAADVMAEAFPDRMKFDYKDATTVLQESGYLGQKTNQGFYNYSLDKRGKPKKVANDSIYELLAPFTSERQEFTDEEIIARTMLPMCTEMARCLEEQIVSSAPEADLALIYGLGFPAFRGGLFRWMDNIGLKTLLSWSEKYSALGKSYELTEQMQLKLTNEQRYY